MALKSAYSNPVIVINDVDEINTNISQLGILNQTFTENEVKSSNDAGIKEYKFESRNRTVSMNLTLKGNKPQRISQRSGLINIFSVLYALLIITCGILFPLVEALQDQWLNSIYNMVLVVYLYSVGIIFLVYILLFLPVSSTYDETLFENDDMKMNNLYGEEQNSNCISYNTIDYDTLSSHEIKSALGDKSSLVSIPSQEAIAIDVLKLGNIFSHEGSSYFLRIGTLLFGVGNIIYVILEIQVNTHIEEGCPTSVYWWTYILRLIFILIQTFVLFKNPLIHINQSRDSITKFGLLHLVATNMCVWMRTLINEILIEFNHIEINDISNSTNYTISTLLSPYASKCKRGVLESASQYLFPFVLEYSLICMAILSVMFQTIDEDRKSQLQKGLTNFFMIDVFEIDEPKNKKRVTNVKNKKTLKISHIYKNTINNTNTSNKSFEKIICCDRTKLNSKKKKVPTATLR